MKNKKTVLFSLLVFFAAAFLSFVPRNARADCYDQCANDSDPQTCYDSCQNIANIGQYFPTKSDTDSIDQSYAQSGLGSSGNCSGTCAPDSKCLGVVAAENCGSSGYSCCQYTTDSTNIPNGGYCNSDSNCASGLCNQGFCEAKSNLGAGLTQYFPTTDGASSAGKTRGSSETVYTYDNCKADGGDEIYCSQFAGASEQSKNLANMSAGSCSFNSDCGKGFTCYQGSCIDDATYQDNVSLTSRAGNALSQTFSSGGSVFSSGGASSNRSVGTTSQDSVINGVSVPKGSVIMSDGSVRDSNYNTILSPGSLKASGNVSSGGSYTLCANGMLGATCSTTVGGTPIVLGAAVTGPGNAAGVGGVATPKCSGNFTEVGGVCFPTNTGLSTASISQIVTNLFFWIMGLFTTLAVLAFVFSGVQYLLSASNEELAKSAKKNATNAVIGIIIGLSGFIIVQAVAAALAGQGYFF